MINRDERITKGGGTVGATRTGKTVELGPRPARPALPALSSARAGVLRAVMASGTAVTVSALAEQLRQHPNTIREHLDALVLDEHLERVRSTPAGRGRPAWLYQSPSVNTTNGPGDMMSGPLGDGGQEYLALAIALMDQVATTTPDPESLARKAGERWGRTLADQAVANGADPAPSQPSDMAVSMLRSLRFEPEPTEDPKQIRLTTCPLLDAARRHPGVVCQVHTGIVRGVIERLGGDPQGTHLTAFAEPGACLLTLPDAR